MADTDASSHQETSLDSQVEFIAEESTDDYKMEFSDDEEMLIARMFKLVGTRWSLIAGRIPGRTADEIEKYWTSKFTSTTHQ